MVFRRIYYSARWLWLFLLVFLSFVICLWLVGVWEKHIVAETRKKQPFMQVTNRQFSLFLYQNPDFMRAHRVHRFGYLPDFSSEEDVKVISGLADAHVSVPPDVLFRYHVWNRLLGKSLALRPIIASEFWEFLQQNSEWLPENWPGNTADYSVLVAGLLKHGEADLSALSLEELPFEVKLAFQGWKNYFKEWEEIKEVRPRRVELAQFVQKHPHYGRSYWRNILPDYLRDMVFRENSPSDKSLVGEEQLTDFLRIALYNFAKADETSTKPSS